MTTPVFLNRATPPSIITLTLLAGISALSMNIFLPSLPMMAQYFNVPYGVMQQSVSLYLALSAALMTGAAEAASVAMTAEAWGATLSDLGGELETVATLLDGRRATATGTSAPPARTVGADDLADLIEQVAATFRNFEIDEALLMELSSTAGSENFEPVQRAVDSFDFEAALKALDTLKLALKHSVTA